ncbi:hypothetical protein BJ912DRAFT_1081632 [Pholiota molesta]|nr:hypothetical protein BJ912DRAFT_1081632 [Pholiota molesta]
MQNDAAVKEERNILCGRQFYTISIKWSQWAPNRVDQLPRCNASNIRKILFWEFPFWDDPDNSDEECWALLSMNINGQGWRWSEQWHIALALNTRATYTRRCARAASEARWTSMLHEEKAQWVETARDSRNRCKSGDCRFWYPIPGVKLEHWMAAGRYRPSIVPMLVGKDGPRTPSLRKVDRLREGGRAVAQQTNSRHESRRRAQAGERQAIAIGRGGGRRGGDMYQPICPINELPTEILCEIFSRCVDHSSARVLMQPNAEIAPMLLCHVCANWRAAVLSIPPFWAHFRFELPLNWHSNGRPYTWDPELFLRRVGWLRWWRRNLGAMAPHLQVEIREKEGAKYQGDVFQSLPYISVGRLYCYLVQRRTEAGYIVRIHPNAHTIVCAWAPRSEFGTPHSCNEYQKSVLSQTHSTLRYITIENVNLRAPEFTNSLNNWSTLTHISMSGLILHPNAWFSFIRSLSALQSGSFRLRFEDGDIETYARPSVCTLPCLAVFHITVTHAIGYYPLKAAFDNLQLPALRTLSLRSRVATWYDATALTEVHAALMSAPAITKLSLGLSFLGGQMFSDWRLTPISDDITPLVECAPRLEHLSFAIENPLRRYGWLPFVDRVFASSRWLDLKNPTSIIREVTFVLPDTSQPLDVVAECADRFLLILEVRKFAKDEVIVGCEEEGSIEVRRAAWGWRVEKGPSQTREVPFIVRTT